VTPSIGLLASSHRVVREPSHLVWDKAWKTCKDREKDLNEATARIIRNCEADYREMGGRLTADQEFGSRR
jgi:hypothetical protein